jgi:predicted alpha/beta hydrolase family esterase
MLARLQQGIVAGLLVLLAAWLFAAREWPWWVGLAGVLVLVSAHAVFLALEFLLMHAVNRGDPAPRASPAALMRAWVHESLTAPRVFLWHQPMRSGRWPDRVPAAGTGLPGRRPGVVLAHGFVCNRGLWNPWLARLTREGRAFCAVNLEPVFGSIDDYVPLVDAAVRRMTDATGLPPLVVCHSMGGLAVRAWLRAHQADTRVAHVVTLGSPHQGTWLARWSFVTNASQMRADSRWLAQLRRDEPAHRAALFTCYYSACDNIVFPASAAVLPGARHVLLDGVAHVDMAFLPGLMDAVLALPEAA